MPNTTDLPDWFEENGRGQKLIQTYNLALHLRAKHPTAFDLMGLIIYDKENGVWISGKDNVKAYINNIASNEFLRAERTNKLVSEVIGAIEAITSKEFGSTTVDKPAVGKLSLANGTYDILTGDFEEVQYHPEYYIKVKHPIVYIKDAKAPAFERFLDHITENDQEKKQFILEMIGSAFWSSLDETFLQRVVFIYGSGGSGKSVLLKLIRAMAGRTGVTDLGVAAMTKTNGFNLDRMYSKNVVIDADTDVDRISDTSLLRKVTGGDVWFADIKRLSGRELVSYALVVITTNKLIQILDKEGEFRRRGLVLTLKAKITDIIAKKNHFDFETEIIPELSGIFNLAMDAFRAALDRGEFTISEEMQETTTHWLDSNNKAIMFIQETLDEGQLIAKEGGCIQRKELYNRYRKWENENGSDKPLGQKEFFRRVEAMGYKTTRVRGIKYYNEDLFVPLDAGQKREYVFKGLTNAANSTYTV